MHFSKHGVGAALLAVSVSLAIAQETPPKDTVFAPPNTTMHWLQKSQAIMDGASTLEKPEWLRDQPPEAAIKAAEKIKERAESVREKVATGTGVKESVDSWVKENKAVRNSSAKKDVPAQAATALARSMIFVSQSMPKAELKAAAQESAESGAVMVFRGIKPGQAIDHISKLLNEIIDRNAEKQPAAIINPTLFTEFGVEAVPAIVLQMDGKSIMARGTLSVDYLLEELENHKSGDLGQVGPTYSVAEPDMIEELKRRALGINWEEQKKGAADRFWTNEWPDMNLPVASKDATFLVDPTYTLKKDLIVQGKVVVAAGTQFNSQKIMPMRQTIMIFDGTDERQIKRVKQAIQQRKLSQHQVVLITTNVQRERGFKSFEEIEGEFGQKLYAMEKGITERFKLRAVPSMVYGQGEYFKVDELGIEVKP